MSLTKTLLELTQRITGLERQQRNLIRLGRVKSVSGSKAIIDYAPHSQEAYHSPPIQWIAFEAGEVKRWRAPSIGEQVVVLNLSGGRDEAHAIALPAAYCADFSPEQTDPKQTSLSILDVFHVMADFDGNYQVRANGSVTFITPAFVVDASERISLQTNNYHRSAEVAKTKGVHTQQGDVKIKGALDVSKKVKTPTVVSYASGAFSLSENGAALSEAVIGEVKFSLHRHEVDSDSDYTQQPVK